MTNTIKNVRKPTEQQAMLIKLASRKDGVTRAQVREALGYEAGVNIPVQSMLKHIAERFGYEFDCYLTEGEGRPTAIYCMVAPRKAA